MSEQMRAFFRDNLINSSSDELITLKNLIRDELDQRAQAEQGPAPRKVAFDDIKVTKAGLKLYVESPYLPTMVAGARQFGKWQQPHWVFDQRDTMRLQYLLLGVYGYYDNQPVPVSDVKMMITCRNGSEKQIFALGREIAKRNFRDSKVMLGPNVTILEGEFAGRGGSVNNPRIMGSALGDTVILLVRDVPANLAEAAVSANPDFFSFAD